jgi:hypothetical protein
MDPKEYDPASDEFLQELIRTSIVDIDVEFAKSIGFTFKDDEPNGD